MVGKLKKRNLSWVKFGEKQLLIWWLDYSIVLSETKKK